MTLSDQLELVRKREIAQRLDQGEAEVLAKLAEQLPQPPELDNETREALQPFLSWTTEKSVRYAPAKPYVVAQFILEQSATGATTESILRQVEAISRLHDKYGLSNPTATLAARSALEREFAIDPPRSWKAPEKEMFVTLPAEIRAAISRREKQREVEVRRLQNSVAEEKRRLQADAAKSADTHTEEVTTNGTKS
jgi:hypothetical protein